MSGLTVTAPVAPSILLIDVLLHGRPRPQELAGLPIERVDDAGLARECR